MIRLRLPPAVLPCFPLVLRLTEARMPDDTASMKGLSWLVGLIASVAIALLSKAAPMKRIWSGCEFCGSSRVERWWFGIKVTDRVTENEYAAWVRSIHPEHSNHVWATGSTQQKGWGFAYKNGDYASTSSAVPQIWLLRADFGESVARDFLERYYAQLKTNRSAVVPWLRAEFKALSATNANTPKVP